MNLKDLQPRQKAEIKNSKSFIQYESGISPVFNDQLINMIKQVINTDMPYFFIDCFKHLTRNVEKLFQVLEILLQRNKVLLTSNYYIANNYVAKRTKLLRAIHKTEEIFYKMERLDGLSKVHMEALKKVREELLRHS